MPKPTEHKSVQASRILQYAQEIGWRFVVQSKTSTVKNFLTVQPLLVSTAAGNVLQSPILRQAVAELFFKGISFHA